MKYKDLGRGRSDLRGEIKATLFTRAITIPTFTKLAATTAHQRLSSGARWLMFLENLLIDGK